MLSMVATSTFKEKKKRASLAIRNQRFEQPFVHFQASQGPFAILFEEDLSEDVPLGTVEFVSLEKVPVTNVNGCLFGRPVPSKCTLAVIIHMLPTAP